MRISAIIFALALSTCSIDRAAAQTLKSVVYDFDGFNLAQTDLPEGDYSYGDLAYEVAANPLAASDMLGDRVLKLSLNWSAGYGAFGRGISRYLELSQSGDRLNFFFYNPLANQQAATVEISIADDDNLNYLYDAANDDSWKKTISIAGAAGWQIISVPLSDFTDGNTGGNGTFDIGYSQNKGMLLLVEMRFNKPAPSAVDAVFYVDMIAFSEGTLPTGSSALQLPSKLPGDHCRLGAHQAEAPGNYYLIPSKFEGLFPQVANHHIKFVNTYIHWATNGSTTPHALPGQGYQTLLSGGYTPIITWEPLFDGYGYLDPVQPRLSNIINGDYDAYIDAFADKIKAYTGTIIIRPMHEFDGDWYAWSVSQNGQDPSKYAQAFQHLVNRFNAKNVSNVEWLWCPNSDPVPHRSWNWIVSAYPGDNYADYVGTDVYNAHYPAALPWWRSFRWQTAEVYYYLTKYFPSKPVIIAELACRERKTSELITSQSKADWWASMDKELQSNFRKVRGLVFFNESKDQSWAINTSQGSMNSLRDNIWYDDYYFTLPTAFAEPVLTENIIYPNPANGICYMKEPGRIAIYDLLGTCVYRSPETEDHFNLEFLSTGMYFVVIDDKPACRLMLLAD
jgi:hypothetical protein